MYLKEYDGKAKLENHVGTTDVHSIERRVERDQQIIVDRLSVEFTTTLNVCNTSHVVFVVVIVGSGGDKCTNIWH